MSPPWRQGGLSRYGLQGATTTIHMLSTVMARCDSDTESNAVMLLPASAYMDSDGVRLDGWMAAAHCLLDALDAAESLEILDPIILVIQAEKC